MSIAPAPAGGGSAGPDPVGGLLAGQASGRAGKTDNGAQDDSTDSTTAGSSFAQMLAGALGQSSAAPPAQQTASAAPAGGTGGDSTEPFAGSPGAALDPNALANDLIGQLPPDPAVVAGTAAASANTPGPLPTAVPSASMQPLVSAADANAALDLLNKVATTAAAAPGPAAATASQDAGAKLAADVQSIVGKAGSGAAPPAPAQVAATTEPATPDVAVAALTPVQTQASSGPDPFSSSAPPSPSTAQAASDPAKVPAPAAAPTTPALAPQPPAQAPVAAAAPLAEAVSHAGFGVAVQALGSAKPGAAKSATVGDVLSASPSAVQPSVTKQGLAAAAVPVVEAVADKSQNAATNGDEQSFSQPGQEQTSQPSGPTVSAAVSTAAFQPTSQVTPTGVSHTVARLSADIVKNVQAKSSRFEVGLDPAGLGRVNVKVHIGANGALTAQLSFDNAQSAEALKARSSELRSALEQAGFSLEGSSLSFTSGDTGRQADSGAGGRFKASAAFAAAAAAAEPDFAAIQAGQTASGGLDVRI